MFTSRTALRLFQEPDRGRSGRSRHASRAHATRPFSRRRALRLALLGAAFGPASALRAGEPPQTESTRAESTGEGELTAGRSAEPLVRQLSTRVIRLDPISRDFDRTIVRAIAVDPRRELFAVAGDDHAIRILVAGTMQVRKTLVGHVDLIQTLAFDATGKRLVSAGNDGQLILWDRSDEFRIVQRMTGTPALSCVRFAPDGSQMAAVGFQSDVFLIGHTRSDQRPKLHCECTDLRAVAYRGDGRMLAVAGRSGDLHLFDRESNRLLGEHKIHRSRVRAMRFVDGSPVVVSAGEDGVVVLFDTDARQIVKRIPVTSGRLFSVTILDHRHLAVAGSDNVIRIVNASTGRIAEQLRGHTGSIAALASDGAVLYSGGYDATLRQWSLSGIESDRERIAERDQLLDR